MASTEEITPTEEIAEVTEETTTEEVVEKDNSVSASLSRAENVEKQQDTKPVSNTGSYKPEVKPANKVTDVSTEATVTTVVAEVTPEPTTETPTTEAPTTEAPTTENTDPSYGDLVWVVDREARWVEIPVYETRCREVCNGCGEDITGKTCEHGTTYEEAINGCGGWHDDYYTVQTGTQWVYEEEQGHWECPLWWD